MKQTILITLTAWSLGLARTADMKAIHEDFNYGPQNNDNIPGWYDQTGTSEYYNKSGDENLPFDAGTGSIGFHWYEGVGQYIYIFLGTFSGQKTVSFSFLVGNYNGTPKTKIQPGEFMIGMYKNNKDIPADNLDIAALTGSRLIDSMRISFSLTGPGANVWKLGLEAA